MNMKKGLLYLSIFLVMAALACKSDVESPKPVGVWEKVSRVPHEESPGTLEFKANSLFYFTATSEGHTDSQGKYSILDGKITFEDDTCYTPGTYEYGVEDNELRIALIKDTCMQRANALGGTWRRATPAGE